MGKGLINASPPILLMKVLVLGNEMVRADSLPHRLLPALRRRFPDIEFKEADTAENIEEEGRDLIILDCALGIEEATLIDDLEQLKLSRACSLHDFDLPITLRILMRLKAIDSVRIIALPARMDEEEAMGQASDLIARIRDEDGQASPPSS